MSWSWSRGLLLWLTAFVLLFPLNGLVHVGPGAPLFDHALSGLASAAPMRDGSPLVAALIDVNLAGAMALLLLRSARQTPGDGALIGALLGLVASGTWNLANGVVLRGWPTGLMALDMAWHVTLGGAAGALLALAAGRLGRRTRAPA